MTNFTLSLERSCHWCVCVFVWEHVSGYTPCGLYLTLTRLTPAWVKICCWGRLWQQRSWIPLLNVTSHQHLWHSHRWKCRHTECLYKLTFKNIHNEQHSFFKIHVKHKKTHANSSNIKDCWCRSLDLESIRHRRCLMQRTLGAQDLEWKTYKLA